MACLRLLQNDHMPASISRVDEYDMVPIFSSLRLCERNDWATMTCEFATLGEGGDRQEVDICPRTALRRQLDKANSSNTSFLIGFEIEVVFLPIDDGVEVTTTATATTISPAHAWSSVSSLYPPKIISLLEETLTGLEKTKIPLLHIHPGSAPEHFQLTTSPLTPLEAADTILAARETINSTAARHNLHATYVLNPDPEKPCVGGFHVHTPMVPERYHVNFYAGVVRHT